jgi:hypothetical protein
MTRWSAWSAPLLGGCGGGLAGLALSGNPRFPFPTVYATLGGVALGVLAGLIVRLQDKLRCRNPAVPRDRWAITAPSSRWLGFLLMAAGIGCLAANHALVVTTGKKLFPLVIGGSFFLAVGLAGAILPQILTGGATGERLPWWGHLLGGALAAGGLALGLYLWLAVY